LRFFGGWVRKVKAGLNIFVKELCMTNKKKRKKKGKGGKRGGKGNGARMKGGMGTYWRRGEEQSFPGGGDYRDKLRKTKRRKSAE